MVWKLLSRTDRRASSVPEGVRIYAVGDIHGRADLLAPLLAQIEIDITLHPISRPIVIFLGDYIDRGPSSRAVLELLTGKNLHFETVFLKGNHEAFLLKFLDSSEVLDDWRQCGGLETLISFGIKPPINPAPYERAQLSRSLSSALPATHRHFLETLKPTFVCGDFIFVHAGLRPLVPIEQQNEGDLLWIRDDFLLWDREFEKIVVHGHTPVGEPDIRFNRINIDTGAFATGRLTCLTIEGAEIATLIDVREWTQNLPRLAQLPELERTGAGKDTTLASIHVRAMAAELKAQVPHLAAAIHAKQLRESLSFYDKDSLARLDPRKPRPGSSSP
ncbi:metallophosphoesterase [Bradyrhizobium sp. SYSU BS000235]|uniref:metallophosphoesterase n=1 Tax=Bradyrhizobium sp. SYSU BS000235 TaxID=3411332 RepID=UPI003C7314C9